MFIFNESEKLIDGNYHSSNYYPWSKQLRKSSSSSSSSCRKKAAPKNLPSPFAHNNFLANINYSLLSRVLIFAYVITSLKIPGIQGEKLHPEGIRVIELNGINCDIKKDILEAHNEMRQLIAAGLTDGQPSASNMRQLYWDEELAEGAQKWANHCTFKHNELIDREISRFQVGQNIAMTKNRGQGSDAKEFRKQVKNWFEENAHYNFGVINENLQLIGHYTQLVWADTYLVGCGYSRYEDTIKKISYRLYVCHYGPSGNVHDEEPYKKGNRKCPEDTIPSSRYDALCALDFPPTDNCNKPLELQSDHKEEKKFPVNTRRSEWLDEFQKVNENRRILQKSKKVSPVGFQNDNIDPYTGPEDHESTFILFRLIISI